MNSRNRQDRNSYLEKGSYNHFLKIKKERSTSQRQTSQPIGARERGNKKPERGNRNPLRDNIDYTSGGVEVEEVNKGSSRGSQGGQ